MRSDAAAAPAVTVDCDLRCAPTLADVAPEISAAWREHYGISDGGREVLTAASGSAAWGGLLPGPLWGRLDADVHLRPSPEEVCRLLDRYGITRAVLNPGIAPRLTGLSNHTWAAELARATNTWLERTWLDHDERFLGSVVVAARNPRLAAEEIRRFGRHPRVVQVVLAFPHVYLGDRMMLPVYEAAAEHGLAVCLQAGGAYTGSSRGLTGVGHPVHAYEAEAAWAQAAQPHLTSLVAHGIFERFPGLRLVLAGFGAAWIPSLFGQLDRSFRDGAVELPPTMRQIPSTTLREHVRLTTDHLDGDPAQVADLLARVEGASLLVFGSGARGLADEPAELADAMPATWRDEILASNAASWYRTGGAVAA